MVNPVTFLNYVGRKIQASYLRKKFQLKQLLLKLKLDILKKLNRTHKLEVFVITKNNLNTILQNITFTGKYNKNNADNAVRDICQKDMVTIFDSNTKTVTFIPLRHIEKIYYTLKQD